MFGMVEQPADETPVSNLLVEGLSAAFTALGRILLCVGPDFRVVHASELVDSFLGGGSRQAIKGRPVEEILPEPLFGAGGSLRQALERGERREGWRARLMTADGANRLMSLTVAPISHAPGSPCDPRVAYLFVLRPDQDPEFAASWSPTGFSGMVARSPAMLRIFHLIEILRDSDATVLLTGESGTGKELAARAIHEHSPRHNGPFVAVNCAALPPDLLESELFGHVRGSFTGAVRDRVGRFEMAGQGTLFLDEVGDLPLPLQVKLLRVLQERTFERVGESVSRKSDARIVAATNRDMRLAIESGAFRDDLFYRLRVVPIELPPLRDRKEDIEPLAEVLLSRIGRRRARSQRLSPTAIRALMRYSWPGNVRELENALEYAVAVCSGQTIHVEHLPDEVQRPESYSAPAGAPPESSTGDGTPEARELRAALEVHQWRRADTARALGISRTTLWRRMREHNLV